MNLKWVNHASYILESENIRLVTDPWIEGRVFNESWSLLVPAELTFEDFKDITHIWFSHEHPDHFFPPNLTKIPQEYRNNITVLFQKTSDNKVAAFCTKIGLKSVVELNEYNPICIGDDIEVTIGKVTNDSDSWLFLEKNDIKILNLNDSSVVVAAVVSPAPLVGFVAPVAVASAPLLEASAPLVSPAQPRARRARTGTAAARGDIPGW